MKHSDSEIGIPHRIETKCGRYVVLFAHNEQGAKERFNKECRKADEVINNVQKVE
jgi:hypothetical protein